MKPIHWLLLLAVAVAAYMWGRKSAEIRVLQTDVVELKGRVLELERVNIRQEERWGWAKRIAGGVKGLLTGKK